LFELWGLHDRSKISDYIDGYEAKGGGYKDIWPQYKDKIELIDKVDCDES